MYLGCVAVVFIMARLYFNTCNANIKKVEYLYDECHEEIEDTLQNLLSIYTARKIPDEKQRIADINERTRAEQYKSGICNHMIFETKYINELISTIEQTHNDDFFNIFLQFVSKDHINGAGASEYEIYFNYMLKNHKDKIIIRELKWGVTGDLNKIGNLDYVSYHWYMRSDANSL